MDIAAMPNLGSPDESNDYSKSMHQKERKRILIPGTSTMDSKELSHNSKSVTIKPRKKRLPSPYLRDQYHVVPCLVLDGKDVPCLDTSWLYMMRMSEYR